MTIHPSDRALGSLAGTAEGPRISAGGESVSLEQSGLGQRIMDLVRRIRSMQQRARTMTALSGLDERTLRDIGVHDIPWVAHHLARAQNDNAQKPGNDNAREAGSNSAHDADNDNAAAKSV